MSGSFNSAGFEIENVFDLRGYPAARRSRQGPPSAAGGVGGAPIPATLPAPPQSYVFAFALRTGNQTRSTTSTPRLKGPSIVRGLTMAKGGSADGLQGIGLGKSLSAVTENLVAITTPLPYTPLITGLSITGVVIGAPNQTVSPHDMQTSVLSNDANLGIVVLDRDWFLCITAAAGNTGTPDEHHGYVTVLDQVPAETLALYVG